MVAASRSEALDCHKVITYIRCIRRVSVEIWYVAYSCSTARTDKKTCMRRELNVCSWLHLIAASCVALPAAAHGSPARFTPRYRLWLCFARTVPACVPSRTSPRGAMVRRLINHVQQRPLSLSALSLVFSWQSAYDCGGQCTDEQDNQPATTIVRNRFLLSVARLLRRP